jgi:hypothetical protein
VGCDNMTRKMKKTVKLKVRARMIIDIILISILFFGSVFLFIFSNNIEYDISKSIIDYNEKSDIKYTVDLKENNYYPTTKLGMNQTYPAQLIKNINIDYSYDFNFSKDIEYEYSYYTYATVVINDKNNTGTGNSLLLDKTYQLDAAQTGIIKDKQLHLDRTYIIDYATYNNFVNQYRASLGLVVDAKVRVIMHVEVSAKYLEHSIHQAKDMEVDIPLINNSISININNPKDIDDKITEDNIEITGNTFFMIFSVIMFIVSIALFVQEFTSVIISDKEQSKYIKQLNKIVNANSDVIVRVKNRINLKGHNVMEVDSIEKLLDVQNELRIPIAYYEEIENKKGYFVIVNGNDAWEYRLSTEEER